MTETEPARTPPEARYESLIRLSEAIRSSKPKDLFETLVAELRLIVPFHTIGHYDALTQSIHWRVQGAPPSNDPIQGLPLEETIIWWSYSNQQPVIVPSVDRESRFPVAMQIMKRIGVRSLCALPLTTAHRRLGSLVFASQVEDLFTPEEVRFLSMAAAQIALALDDSYNFRESQRTAERLQLLLELNNRVVSTLDLRDLLRQAAANIRTALHCDAATIALPDPDTGRLRIYAMDFPSSKGVVAEGADVVPTQLQETAFRTGEILNMTEEQVRLNPMASAEGAKSLCHFPLVGRAGVLGIGTVGSKKANAFSQDDADFLGRVAHQVAIAIENALAHESIKELKDKLAQEKIYLEDEIRTELNFEEIVGSSDGLRQVLQQVEIVSPTDSTVLIYGETGTGKELIARAVHNLSSRASHAFVKLNCAAIPTGLLESELFGHERGAFTGAIAQRIGRFELANKGTIFLDEVGEIPLELQPKLLRVLQEREFERLGSSRTLKSDARLIAATNRDLEAMAAEGKFRADLYYRLNVFPIRIPPLRERPEDIPPLVRHFVQQFSRRRDRAIESIPTSTMDALVHYHWPGNIRELQNVIERAVIVSKGSVLKVPVADLKSQPSRAPSKKAVPPDNLRAELNQEERARILAALEESNWIVAGPNGAAARLGMKRSTLQFRMQKLGVSIARSAG